MHKLELTNKQQKVYDFLEVFIKDTGYPPTHLEICEGLGYKHVNSAACHLSALARKQAIQLIPGKARGIKCLL